MPSNQITYWTYLAQNLQYFHIANIISGYIEANIQLYTQFLGCDSTIC